MSRAPLHQPETDERATCISKEAQEKIGHHSQQYNSRRAPKASYHRLRMTRDDLISSTGDPGRTEVPQQGNLSPRKRP